MASIKDVQGANCNTTPLLAQTTKTLTRKNKWKPSRSRGVIIFSGVLLVLCFISMVLVVNHNNSTSESDDHQILSTKLEIVKLTPAAGVVESQGVSEGDDSKEEFRMLSSEAFAGFHFHSKYFMT
ncbi:hypothetical protein FRX31_008123, partial [Thalictrum thalictroides]